MCAGILGVVTTHQKKFAKKESGSWLAHTVAFFVYNMWYLKQENNAEMTKFHEIVNNMTKKAYRTSQNLAKYKNSI